MLDKDKKTPEKIIRLVEYLSTLTRINTKIVRTLDDYRKILWIHKIPREPKYCFTQAWGQEEEHDDEAPQLLPVAASAEELDASTNTASADEAEHC